MAPAFAVSFENRARRDKLAFIIKLEFLVIFVSVLAVLFLVNQNPLLKIVFSLLASVSLLLVLKDRLQRAGRRLKRAVVRSVKCRGAEGLFFLPMGHPFTLTGMGYEIEAVSEDLRLVRFLDWRPWKVGQQLLVLLDIKGRILAVRDIRNPLRLELLKQLA